MAPTHGQDDAQRTMEQRALRNVRDLVDKVEAQDRAQQATDRRGIVSLALFAASAVVLIAVVFLGSLAWRKFNAQEPTPAKAAPASAMEGVIPGTAGAYRDHVVAKLQGAYKADPGRGLRGTAVVRMSIRPDGSVESMEIARTSGQKLLDQTAMDIVREAAPFDSFASRSVTGTKVVQVTHGFTFAE